MSARQRIMFSLYHLSSHSAKNVANRKRLVNFISVLVALGFFAFSLPSWSRGVYRGDIKKSEIELLEEHLVFGNKWIQFFNDRVRFPNGQEGTYVRILTPKIMSGDFNATAVLPITADGNVILEKIFRHAPRKWLLEVPRGFWWPDETSLQSAKRELYEETGFSCPEWHDAGSMYPDSGVIGTRVQLFVAQGCAVAGKATDSEETFRIRLKSYPWQKVMKMVEKGEIQDSFTMALLLKAQKYLDK